MTQAFNLSQLANGANTSGQLNASTYLFNQVPVANGGTALSSAGAAGNMLVASSASAYSAVTMPTFGYRNRIINGNMVIDQRNNGASVTINTSTPFIVDRFNGYSDLANMTGQRSTTVPSGFTNSVSITVGTGASPTSGQISRLEQRIEGFNIADLGWGAAGAQAVTLSFWVRSSITGTHSGAIGNSAGNRSYPFTFTISAANTWEYETITIPGDTTGTWLADNGTGVRVLFNLGTGSTFLGTAGAWAASNFFGATGSVQLSATTGATFFITGVQLERGSIATAFDYRDYGRELIMCQRYYQKYQNILVSGYNGSTGSVFTMMSFPVELRATPSLVYSGIAYSNSSNLITNVINTKLVRFGLQITSTGLGFATADIETSGAEL
jgi:hypothetical protein